MTYCCRGKPQRYFLCFKDAETAGVQVLTVDGVKVVEMRYGMRLNEPVDLIAALANLRLDIVVECDESLGRVQPDGTELAMGTAYGLIGRHRMFHFWVAVRGLAQLPNFIKLIIIAQVGKRTLNAVDDGC